MENFSKTWWGVLGGATSLFSHDPDTKQYDSQYLSLGAVRCRLLGRYWSARKAKNIIFSSHDTCEKHFLSTYLYPSVKDLYFLKKNTANAITIIV